MKEEEKVFTRETVALDFSQLSSLILKDLNDTSGTSSLATRYTKANLIQYLQNPSRYMKELAKLSDSIHEASPHYRRLVNYYAKMSLLDYVVEPSKLDTSKVNMKTFLKSYKTALDYIETLNIKHEFSKALQVAWVKDTFYGFELIGKDSYFIQEMPHDYCQISSIEDGVYNYSMNMEYFDRNPTQLELFPKEFKKLYNAFKGGKGKWQEVPSERTVCLKINETKTYDLPPFIGVIASVFDIEDNKALKATRDTIANYKFLVSKIPVRKDSEVNNDFMIDLPTVSMFHNKTMATLPEEIGLITTPFDTETIDFSKDNSERDNVQEAEREFYTSAGTSSQLFNGDNASMANLGKSINVDEQDIFKVNRQIERIINRKMKYDLKGTNLFKISILDTTIYNREKMIEQTTTAMQYGFPLIHRLGAMLGISPSSIDSMNFLETQALGLADRFKPLSSSHTQSDSKSSDGGRPTNNEDDLSEKGEEQVARDDNNNRE